MTTDFQALLKRIANGETTEADVLAVTSLTHPFMGIDFAAGESKTRIFHAGEMFVPLAELEAAKANGDIAAKLIKWASKEPRTKIQGGYEVCIFCGETQNYDSPENIELNHSIGCLYTLAKLAVQS